MEYNDVEKFTKNVVAESLNANNLIEPGIYASKVFQNTPAGNGWIVVFEWLADGNRGRSQQIYFRYGTMGSTDNNIYVRTGFADGNWGEWVKIMTSRDMS